MSQSKFNMVHLKAMMNKDWLQMKAERKKTIMEVIMTVVWSALIGYEVSLSFNDSSVQGLGFVIFILISPVAFQSACVYIFNEMVKDRENKMKESLRIMGLNKYMYSLSIILQRSMWTTVTVLIMSIMTYVLNMDNISFGQFVTLFIALWFLAVNFLGFSLVAQNLFSDSKLAAIIAPFLMFLPTGVALLCIITPVT